VAYTGTHDNDTTCGWYQSLDDISRHQARMMTQANALDIAWDMMRLAWHLPSDTAIAPAQDVLRLGSEARMNTPGIAEGNWAWRMLPRAWTAEHSAQLRLLTEQSGRLMG
jgi:4-alpha-glucanotransferase